MKKAWTLGALFILSGCGDVKVSSKVERACAVPAGLKKVSVAWTANRERAVNSAGGGYRVYYCDYPGFALSAASFKDVPYVSGSASPTSVEIADVGSGSLYIQVVGYSALRAPNATAGAQSQPSTEVTVAVP